MKRDPDRDRIRIVGAREHNLRGVSVTLPKNKLICFTGVSGSGKSSLAFDTLYAEGQRRYIESLSSYARQFLGQLPRPDVDQITGLSPSISIQQKTSGWNPRSTVGTITQIHDYLRVLMARAGIAHCPSCNQPITAQTREQMIGRIFALGEGVRIMLLAPKVRAQKGEHRDLFEELLRQGFVRARVDGAMIELSNPPPLDRYRRHDIEVVVDRLVITATARGRLAESLETALRVGEGVAIVVRQDAVEQTEASAGVSSGAARLNRRVPAADGDLLAEVEAAQRAALSELDSDPQASLAAGAAAPPSAASGGRRRRAPRAAAARGGDEVRLSAAYACGACGLSYEPPNPQLFSFNSPQGMCSHCDGLGTRFDFDPDLLVPDPTRDFLYPCVAPLRHKPGRWRRHIYEGVARHLGFDLKTPWKDLPRAARQALLYGTGDAHITFEWRGRHGVWKHGGVYEGVIAELQQRHRKASSAFVRSYYEQFMRQTPCARCGGARLNPQALAVTLSGCTAPGAEVAQLNIDAIGKLPIHRALYLFENLKLDPVRQLIAQEPLKEIVARLRFLLDVGLDYLTLDRSAPTLSGGESQRIRLASQIGSGLVGVLYVLDEPSIGLHPRDNRRLIASLQKLRDMGNTVVVVEHDRDTMEAADEIVDFGPGPGVRGGEIVAHGSVAEVMAAPRSLTGGYLAGRLSIDTPQTRRPVGPRPDMSAASRSKPARARRKVR